MPDYFRSVLELARQPHSPSISALGGHAVNVLAPGHHPVSSFHMLGVTHHFTPGQGSIVLGLVVVVVVVSVLAGLFRSTFRSD